jgi:hypothetical protein
MLWRFKFRVFQDVFRRLAMGAIRKTMAILLVSLAVVLAGIALADEGAAPPKAEDGVQPAPAEPSPAEAPLPAEAPKPPTPKLTLKSTSLGILPQPLAASNASFTVSPDARRWALKREWEFTVDGKEMPSSPAKVFAPVFSPDSRHYAYSGSAPGSSFVVMDGALTHVDGEITGYCFSPDSQHFAYIVKGEKTAYLVVDGEKGKEYPGVLPYRAPSDPWGISGQMDMTVFSPDSKHVAYVAKLENKTVMVLDGKEQGSAMPVVTNNMPSALFSPDSQHFAFWACAPGGIGYWVIDGKGEAESGTGVGRLIFSPDSQHTAYSKGVWEKEIRFVVRDGVPCKEYDEIYGGPEIEFSPDSQHLIYYAKRGKDKFKYERLLVVDDKEESVSPSTDIFICYSPDSKHTVLVKGNTMMVDGVEHKMEHGVGPIAAYSPDSNRFAIVVSGGLPEKPSWGGEGTKGNTAVMLDFVTGPYYDTILHWPQGHEERALFFSSDSKHIAYFGKSGADCYLVVDGSEQALGVVPWSAPVFDSPTKFHYIGLKGDSEVMLVEVEIGE